jgi:hypothetical protein
LSRDQEDVAARYKLLSFASVKLVTLSECVINELHVGLKGTMNALFRKDLAQKGRRGLEARAQGSIWRGVSVMDMRRSAVSMKEEGWSAASVVLMKLKPRSSGRFFGSSRPASRLER